MIVPFTKDGAGARPRPRKSSRVFKPGRILMYLVVLVGAFLMLYPLLWLVSASFKPEDLIFANASLFSPNWITGNYTDGWNALDYPFSLFFLNSLIVCLGAVVGNLISCSLAAYAFARLKFRFKVFWFIVMQGMILLPTHVLIVPQYILFKDLGWINTFLPLIAPKFFATDAFFIFLMIQFIRGIPTELDDAAKIDGCNRFTFYWRVILPLTLPGLVAVGIYLFIASWNEYLFALMLAGRNVRTVTVALQSFIGENQIQWGLLMAGGTLVAMPATILFLLTQRRLVGGLTGGAVKG